MRRLLVVSLVASALTAIPSAPASAGANPEIRIDDAWAVEREGITTEAEFWLHVDGGSEWPLTVTVETRDGTATAGEDYAPLGPTVLTLTEFDTRITLTVTVHPDDVDEGNEDFFIVLSDPSSGAIVGGEGRGLIIDDDDPPISHTVSDRESCEQTPYFGHTFWDERLMLCDLTGVVPSTSFLPPGDELVVAPGVNFQVEAFHWLQVFGTITNHGTFTLWEKTGGLLIEGGTFDNRGFVDHSDVVSLIGGGVVNNFGTWFVTWRGWLEINSDGSGSRFVNHCGSDFVPAPNGVDFTPYDAPVDVSCPVVSVSDVVTVEGDAGTTDAVFTVTLSAASTGATSVSAVTSPGTATPGVDYVSVGPTVFEFGAGETSMPFVVPVLGDDVDEADEQFLVTLSAPVNASIAEGKATGLITDDDTAGATVSGSPMSVTEGGATKTYSVMLDSQPTGSVTIGRVVVGSDVTVVPASRTFTMGNWNIAQTFTVTAVDDDVDETSPEVHSVTHVASSADSKYSGIAVASMTANVTDNDVAGVTVSPTSVNVTEGGTTGSYTVVLDTQPTANVTVTRSVVGSDVTVSPASRTFTPGSWNTPQSFTVTAVDDAIAEGLHTGTVRHSASSGDAKYSGVGVASVTANITDDDAAGVSIIESGGSTSVTEGGSGDSYSVVLTAEPVANVTVIATVAGTEATVVPPFRTFTPGNWNVAQTFTVTAVDDPVAETSPHGDTITHLVTTGDPGFSGVVISDVAVSIFDDDTAGVKVTPTTIGVTEGLAGSMFTAVLNTEPSASVTVTPTVVAGQATVTPSGRTFTAANWNVPQSFTVVAVDDEVVEGSHGDTITLATSSADPDYQAVGVSSVTIDVTDNDTLRVPLPGPSVTVTGSTIGAPGVAASFNVTINNPAGPTTFVWQALRSGLIVATGAAQIFTFTPAVGGIYLVSVTVTDDGTSSVVGEFFTVLGDIEGSVFVSDIIWMATQGITAGCNPPTNDLFCPADNVTRGQMATFLARALGLPPSDDDGPFTDHLGSVHRRNINALRLAGITSGCAPDRFCPANNVTRAQMGTFLTNALGLTPSEDDGLFTDHVGSVHRRNINALRISGITAGCNPPDNTMFCPADPVKRRQMAAFLRRALG